MKRNRQFRQVRRRFWVALWGQLRVVWPIVSGLVALQLVLGAFVSLLQGWPLADALYFTFVTAFTIGYGDLVPTWFLARLVAMVIGLTGVLLTGLVAAVGVSALHLATEEEAEEAQAMSGATMSWVVVWQDEGRTFHRSEQEALTSAYIATLQIPAKRIEGPDGKVIEQKVIEEHCMRRRQLP